MTCLFSMTPQAVGIVDPVDKPAILRALAERFAAGWGLDAEAVLERLEERERLGSTGFGRGVAIPHARFPGVARPIAALLKLRHPAEFGAADGLPVSLVFGLLSPETSGVAHLHALAAISRLVRDQRTIERLVDATSEEALFSLVSDATDRDAA